MRPEKISGMRWVKSTHKEVIREIYKVVGTTEFISSFLKEKQVSGYKDAHLQALLGDGVIIKTGTIYKDAVITWKFSDSALIWLREKEGEVPVENEKESLEYILVYFRKLQAANRTRQQNWVSRKAVEA